ncbi:MAG: TolC family protein [Saprospiraceae bacterium]|nr:TolC family protein [Saprospiraceae bacterium]
MAQTRLDVGRGNQLDVFQAQSDLNTQKTALMRQNQAIAMAKMLVNQLMMDETTLNFTPADSLILNENIDFGQLKRDAVGKNNTLNLLKRQQGIAILTQKEAETFRKPRIVANSSFNLGRTDNTAGFLLLNQSAGLNAGITLTYPIYDGGNIKRQVENAKIATESTGFQIKETEYNIASNLNLAFQNYKNALEILRGEEENIKISRQSIEIAMERFRLSRSTILELRQIQQSYEAALIRAISARFDAKNAEIDMLWLSGNLVIR